MNYIDFAVILVIALTTFWGYFRGFVISVLRTFSLLIALILARVFHVPFADFLFRTFPELRQQVYAGVESFVLQTAPSGSGGGIDYLRILGDSVPPEVVQSFPKDLPPQFNLSEVIGDNPLVKGAVERLTSQISTFVIHCISYALLFLAIIILIEIVIFFFKRVRSLPVIGTFDRMLGGVLGLIQGIVLVTLALFILSHLGNAGIAEAPAAALKTSGFAYRFLDFSWIHQFIRGIYEITAKDFGIFWGQ